MHPLEAAEWRPRASQWQVKERAATIAFCRPERKNALTS